MFFFLYFNMFQVVGKGAFGTVYKAQWRDHFVAVKYIEPETERNAFRIEVNDERFLVYKYIDQFIIL